MRLLLSLSLVLVAGYGAIATTASAQDSAVTHPRAYFGPLASINWNDHTGSFRASGVPGCAEFDNGNGFGFGFGLTASLLPDSGAGWSINPAVSYEERPGGRENVSAGDAGVIGQISEIAYTLFSAEIMYGQEVARVGDIVFGVKVGPAFQYILEGAVRQRNLTENEATVCFDGDIPDRNPSRFFVKLGAEASITFDNGWIASPGLFYEHALTGVRESSNAWKVHSLIFQMGVLIPVW